MTRSHRLRSVLSERRGRRFAGAIDQDGDVAALADGPGDARLDRRAVGDVEIRQHAGLAARRGDLLAHGVERRPAASGERQACARCAQRDRDGAADAAACAGHEGVASVHFLPAASACARARLFSYCARDE